MWSITDLFEFVFAFCCLCCCCNRAEHAIIKLAFLSPNDTRDGDEMTNAGLHVHVERRSLKARLS